jgi:hypothetical protein
MLIELIKIEDLEVLPVTISIGTKRELH